MADEKDIIKDLLSDYGKKAAELQTLRSTIETLAKKYNVPCEFPDASGNGAKVGSSVTADQFFGKSQPDAAEEYLRRVGHAVPVEEILEALRSGGMKFSGKDPRGTLYTQMIRATMRFVKMPSGAFGLLEWYPTEHAKRTRGKDEEPEEAPSPKASKAKPAKTTKAPAPKEPAKTKEAVKAAPREKVTAEAPAEKPKN
jgi:hypothetical protein